MLSRVTMADRVTLDGVLPPIIVLAVAAVLYALRRVTGGRGRFQRFDVAAVVTLILVTRGLEAIRAWQAAM